MIVVDSNIITYLFLPTERSAHVEKLLDFDDWIAPFLWRSELRNVLALYMRKALLDLSQAREIQRKAEWLMMDCEYLVESEAVLSLAFKSGCSAYDCEFVVLAQMLNTSLITYDKKILSSFPEYAKTAEECIKQK